MEGASKRARARGLEAVVTTDTISGMGTPNAIFVLADGTRLVTTEQHTLLQIPLSGRLATISASSSVSAYPAIVASRPEGAI